MTTVRAAGGNGRLLGWRRFIDIKSLALIVLGICLVAHLSIQAAETDTQQIIVRGRHRTENKGGSQSSTASNTGADKATLMTMTTTTKVASQDTRPKSCEFPSWVHGGPADFAREVKQGSLGLTDKVTGTGMGHQYEYLYQPYMSQLVQKKNCKPIRMLEIGLGCAPGGGMKQHTPGGSALAWKHMYQGLNLDLHIMEYDAACANKWAAQHPDIHVHTGDASSEDDLKRVAEASGGEPFDIIIDDASHINWHQIKTLEVMISHVNAGGIYVIEDIQSACNNWKANEGTRWGQRVGGSEDCLTTQDGKPTIFSKIVDWQKGLLLRKEPFPGVNHIDLHKEAVAFGKIVA